MTSTYTKGPWVVVVDESASQVKGYPCIVSDDYVIVGTEGMYSDIETDFANANLIAAAPDLIEALEYARRFMKADTFDLVYIDAAIAKAKGEK